MKEAIFSIEGKHLSTQEFESRATPGKKTGVLAFVEGVRFWVREDALNEERNIIDPGVLGPMGRLGGIMYGRTVEGCEFPRPDFAEKKKTEETDGLAMPSAELSHWVLWLCPSIHINCKEHGCYCRSP